MIMKSNLLRLAVVGLAAAALGGAAMAQARDAASLRAGGQVGEQADGFLGCVSTCDPATRAAIADINAKRADAYRRAAAEAGDGATAAAAGAAAYRQIVARLPAGQYHRPPNGGWTRK
jgi:uncharacterized protein YdbL (DUF1318 family)